MSHHHVHDLDRPLGNEATLPPSGRGTVVLDIGEGVGALVVHTPSALCGAEIDIARRGESTAFVHTEVRERVLPEGSVYAGVFVALDEGDYTLLDVGKHPRRDVTIESGRVTEVELVT
jgi:hypothetical protein